MTRLLVNIDHVATLRNARREAFPDPATAAALCEDAGADGIVFHLRQDRRHINDTDVARLKATVRGKLDFELSVDEEIVAICCDTVPQLATLVPEKREEVTTEGGIDVVASSKRLDVVIPRLFDAGIAEVALFVDPDPVQIRAAAGQGATAVELHTGTYANSTSTPNRDRCLADLATAAELAHDLGLVVHAGHGLDPQNYPDFRARVKHVTEVSIGFAIIARSVYVGLPHAVEEMIRVVSGPITE
ncbi:MAG: pyridoxine 5'-phosphate synthase [Rhodothermales bacterium]